MQTEGTKQNMYYPGIIGVLAFGDYIDRLTESAAKI